MCFFLLRGGMMQLGHGVQRYQCLGDGRLGISTLGDPPSHVCSV